MFGLRFGVAAAAPASPASAAGAERGGRAERAGAAASGGGWCSSRASPIARQTVRSRPSATIALLPRDGDRRGAPPTGIERAPAPAGAPVEHGDACRIAERPPARATRSG